MRSSPRAFDTMARRLEGVRASGIPFGFIFTLTLHNVHELPWVARFALDQGASLLQVHPLEEAGRAAEALPDSRPDAVESAHAYLQVLAARAAAGERMAVHLDVSDRELLAANPEVVVPPDVGADAAGPPLAELLSPLVVEADGTVVPLQYGFPRQFVMGDITTEPLGTIAARWRVEGFARFRHLCAGVLDRLRQPVTIPLTNLYEEFAAQAAG
jgi:MoaA/NifB/PqqE/SkfB family radical SAM enzyme